MVKRTGYQIPLQVRIIKTCDCEVFPHKKLCKVGDNFAVMYFREMRDLKNISESMVTVIPALYRVKASGPKEAFSLFKKDRDLARLSGDASPLGAAFYAQEPVLELRPCSGLKTDPFGRVNFCGQTKEDVYGFLLRKDLSPSPCPDSGFSCTATPSEENFWPAALKCGTKEIPIIRS
jgi:hypothetical protein